MNQNRTGPYSISAIMGGLYGEGIIGLKDAFDRQWVAQLGVELENLLEEALKRPGGAVGRGPNRYYVEIHPEDITGFAELVSHPWIRTVAESVLGAGFKVVEIGFDIPKPGAAYQPWHRDFAAPEETLLGRQLNSLAFNLTTVDVTEEMGPFEVAVGTQWDDPSEFKYGMFPPQSLYPRYEALAQKKMAQMGDISARSALTIHRGTPNRSQALRPALVLGVDGPSAKNAERHDLQVTKQYYENLPDYVRAHLACRIVDELEPIFQAHTIEGLVMGAPEPVRGFVQVPPVNQNGAAGMGY